jgi:PilZ domain
MESPSRSKPTSETRRSTRERTFLQARIAFGDGAISSQCTVTQLSSSGARLNVSSSVSLPDRFEIAIPQRGVKFRARLVWRHGDQAGVEFEQLDESDFEPLPEDLPLRIRELEAINAKLRAQIAELTLQVARLTEA